MAGPRVNQKDHQAADQKGLVCRHCGCRHFRVIYTRRAWGGRIMRRRECRHCGRRTTTFEAAGGGPSMSQASSDSGEVV